jgi:hypothetical protein
LPGAPGLPGANGVSGYQIKSLDTVPFNAGRNAVLPLIKIACDAGKVPIAGGHEMLNDEAQRKLSVLASAPLTEGDSKGWQLNVMNAYAGSVAMQAQVRIYVVCAQMAQ